MPAKGLIHHSDRGSQYCGNQYCSIDYQAELRQHGVVISMSNKDNCYDNAMVETFFKTIKIEMIWRTRFNTRADAYDTYDAHDAHSAIARYIDGFYNPIRRHSALDYRLARALLRGRGFADSKKLEGDRSSCLRPKF